MKFTYWVLSVLILSSCPSALINSSEHSPARKIAQTEKIDYRKYKKIQDTDHFGIFQILTDSPLSDEQKRVLMETLESGFRKVSNYLGPEKTPVNKLTVLLEGDSFSTDQPPKYPSVDASATIRLYRFQGPGAVYLQGLPHELVHAFRNKQVVLHEVKIGDILKGFGFVEEAFAEFVSVEVDKESTSFVRYGFPLEVVTGYWLTSEKDIPLSILFHHHEINSKCVAQAYPLRASFFKFLDEVYGHNQLISIAYYEKEFSTDLFRHIYGKSFEALATEWKVWALKKYNQFPNNKAILDKYITLTPIKYFPICRSGTDW